MERFLDYFEPEKYALDIEVDKGRKYIGGKVTIFGRAKAENIKFHAEVTSVSSVTVNGEKWDFEHKDGVLTLFKVPRSDLRVEVGYEGALNENMEGAYLSTYEYEGKTETIVATQFESHYARQAFPCVDEPEAKAVFELTIETDASDIVLSNTPSSGRGSSRPSLRGSDHSSLGRNLRKPSDEALPSTKTTAFEPTPRMSTYLLAWVIGKFHSKTVTNAHGVEITTYAALNQDMDSVDFANEIAARSLEFYDDNFGVPYPLKKLDQVALPDFEAGAMENWGLVTYRESMLLVGKSATLSTKKSVALTVAHELSHQWFGDLVTMKWWDDLWLNESFASVMEYYAVDYTHPEYKIFENFFTGDCLLALKRDAYKNVQAVHQDVSDPAEIGALFDSAIVYSKGARLMLMLIRAMGWEKFCKGIRDYFEKFAYQNTVGDDLWNALAPYAEFDPYKLMHAFIDRPGYPVITTRGEGAKSSEYFALPEAKFAEVAQKRFLLDEEKMPESDWPLPALSEDMSGHYIYNLSDAEFNERLARFDKLSLEEKLRLLIDRSLVTKTDLAPSDSLVPLVEKFADENSAAVWNVLLLIINNLKVFFEFGTDEEKAFKKWVGKVVEPKLVEVGLKAVASEDENTLRVRQVLLALDFYAENETNLRALADMYDADVTKIEKEIRDDVLDAKVWLDGAEVCDEFLRLYETTADPEIKFDLLFALTLSRDEKVLARMLELLDRIDVVKPQDQFYLYIYLYRNPRSRAKAYEWLVTHWDFVKKISGDKSLDHYPRLMANAIKSEKDYQGYLALFEPLASEPGLARAIEIGKNEIAATLRLIEKDKNAVAKAIL